MCKFTQICGQTGTAKNVFKTLNKMNALINLLEHWLLAGTTAVIFKSNI